MKKTFCCSLAVIMCAAAAGCTFSETPPVGEEQIVRVENLRIDNYYVQGKNIQEFDAVPQRVLVVGDNEVETLIELGAASSIV